MHFRTAKLLGIESNFGVCEVCEVYSVIPIVGVGGVGEKFANVNDDGLVWLVGGLGDGE